MPKVVDHGVRREQILQAAVEILAEGGPRMLTMRSLAEKLGGSIRLVNYYYPTRRALLEGFQAGLDERWQPELDELDAASDEPRARLHSFLIWSLSLDEESRMEERAWLSLLTVPTEDQAAVATVHARASAWVHDQLLDRLDGLVSSDRLEEVAAHLHVTTRGIIVLSEENPAQWPQNRQVETLDGVLRLHGLLPS